MLLSSPLLAGHKSHKHRHPHGAGADRGWIHYVAPLPPPPAHVHPFRVPTVIRAAHVETYRPYYRGLVHHAPHGHAHAVYSFPAWRDHVLVHETHHYCGGGLYVGAPVAPYGPRLSIRIAF